MAKKTKVSPKLIKYLKKAGVPHEILEHKTVYTAIDAAMTTKKKIEEIAKSLLIKADKDYYVIILPADQNLDILKIEKCISNISGKKVKSVKIPGEKIMESVFKVKAGAMSAFGGLHKLPVIVDNKLAKIKSAVFSSGSFNHSIEMKVKDFLDLEKAILGNFGVKKKIKKQKLTKSKKAGTKKKSVKKIIAKKK